MKISIIIPVYNAERYIDKCINSVISQTHQNWELILINDGSTDRSLQVCEKYQNIDNRIKVFNKVNEGVSKARNYGINQAKSEYLTFIDSDDYIEQDFLTTLISNVTYDFVSLSHKRFGKENSIKTLKRNYAFCLPEDFSDIVSRKDNVSLFVLYPWGKLFKMSIIKRFNIKFCENLKLAEDSLFVITYLSYCQSAVFLPDVLYNYYITQSVSKKYIFDYETYNVHKEYYHKELSLVKSRINISKIESRIQSIYFMSYLEYLSNTLKSDRYSRLVDKFYNLKYFSGIISLAGKKRAIALYLNYLTKG